jgi:hypothetical protein
MKINLALRIEDKKYFKTGMTHSVSDPGNKDADDGS